MMTEPTYRSLDGLLWDLVDFARAFGRCEGSHLVAHNQHDNGPELLRIRAEILGRFSCPETEDWADVAPLPVCDECGFYGDLCSCANWDDEPATDDDFPMSMEYDGLYGGSDWADDMAAQREAEYEAEIFG